MKKHIKLSIVVFACTSLLNQQATAQIPIVDIIKGAIKKAIKAADLKVQRMQNKTIWLQNAQKVVENTMSKARLNDITDWTGKQRSLYAEYFDELSKVKSVISSYQRVRDAVKMQYRIVQEYERAWKLIKTDGHFRPSELEYMQRVYTGILNESVKNIDQLLFVLKEFNTKMSDGERIEAINRAADKIEANFSDLKEFNARNTNLSLQRCNSIDEVKRIKTLYGVK